MSAEHVFVPYIWRRQLVTIRTLLAVLCLIGNLYFPMSELPVLPVLLAVYSAWSVGVLLSWRLEQFNYTTWSLGLDTAFFLAVASNPSQQLLWIGFIAYFYVLLAGALMFPWTKVVGTVAASLAYLLVVRPAHFDAQAPIVLLAGVLASMMALYKKSLQDRLTAAFDRAVMARSEVEIARISERQRIAADFHDGPLQSFISLQMRLEIVRRMLAKGAETTMAEVESVQDICRGQVTELRAFVRSMRPPEVDQTDVAGSLRELLKAFQKDTGVQVTFESDVKISLEDEQIATEILSIVRETLNNVQKHSTATTVAVALSLDDNRLQVRVEDDGRGFPFSGPFTLQELDTLRLGPVSIKRRVQGLGGDLLIDSRPGRGASVRIAVPVG